MEENGKRTDGRYGPYVATPLGTWKATLIILEILEFFFFSNGSFTRNIISAETYARGFFFYTIKRSLMVLIWEESLGIYFINVVAYIKYF